jgi:hypothetical protein
MAALRGDISFRYLKQFFLVLAKINCIALKFCSFCSKADFKNVMARTRKCYLKNNYLTSRSKVKVP